MKRPTKADLDDAAAQFAARATEPETANLSAQLGLDLLREIRRLRGLIADGVPGPILAERERIREEGGA